MLINLRKHEKDLKSENSMVQSLNEYGIIIDVSPEWLKEMQYEKGEVIGKNFMDFLADFEVDTVKTAFPHLKDYGFVDNVIVKLKRKDGTLIQAAIHGTSLYDNDDKFLKTFCEVRTLDYYLNSNEKLVHLLRKNQFSSAMLRIKSNITNLLLDQENPNFWNNLLGVLKEPQEILDVIIESKSKRILRTASELEKANKIYSYYSSQDDHKPLVKYQEIFPDSVEGPETYVGLFYSNSSKIGFTRKVIFIFKSEESLLKDWVYNLENLTNSIKSVLDYRKTYLLNKKLIRELKELSETDVLTKLKNRRSLDKYLQEQKSLFERYKEPASIVIFDLDKFKSINDNYGHLAGDQILIEFAEILRSNSRLEDKIFRWGGDEYLVLLKYSDYEKAQAFAEKIRKVAAETTFSNQIKLEFSYGISAFIENDDIEPLLYRADKNLYKMKNDKKNSQ